MQKFGKIAAFMAGSILLLAPALAEAQTGPFYFTPKVLYSRQNTNDFSADSNYSGGFDIGSSSYSGSDDSNNSFGGGLAIGYDFGATGNFPVRAELEYLIRGAAETDYPAKTTKYINANNYINSAHQGEVTAQTVFSNFYYDFRNDSAFTPYIGAGVGAAYLKGSLDSRSTGRTEHQNSNLYRIDDQYNGSNDAWNFAWNLNAGAAYTLTNNIALDLSYRYSDLGTVEYGTHGYSLHDSTLAPDTQIGTYGGKAEADVTTHEVILGVRISAF